MIMMQKEVWSQSVDEVLRRFKTTRSGLSGETAKERLQTTGENVLEEGKKKTAGQIFLSQFCDLLVVILLIAGGISMISGNLESTAVILLVLVANAVLGTIQQIKAEQSLESLKNLSSPNSRVIRDGKKIEIPSREIVIGDLLELEAGDLIPADGRIVESYSLQVNESSLTGETSHIEKREGVLAGETPLADRTNMVYSGSLVVYGRAVVVVTATGMQTELGKIAGMIHQAGESKTPLQRSLDQFSQKLAILILMICGLVFALCLSRKMTVLDALLFAVALAVAAIPEALTSIVTIVQAFGTQRMAKEHAIIKKLSAVESLGAVSVICSDKTGTLTQNKMTVQQIFVNGNVIEAKALDMTDQTQRYLVYDAVLTNDSSIVDGQSIGDPTESALLEMFREIPAFASYSSLGKQGMNEEILREMMARLEEIPFDSDRKLMSTKYRIHGKETILTKGAVDVLLDRCIWIRRQNEICPMTETEREKIRIQNQQFSERGLRVLAFAYKESCEPLCREAECDYVFLGLISMADPPRPESIKAVRDAKSAGIRTVMITGDHKITAVAIARKIGLFEDGDLALTGMELDRMSEEELDQAIEKISVYARVSPENKIRIVRAWQRSGKLVAMTGDGVNDAPALKKADIGVAMGITGTEVSKDASDMILTDDNFATIIRAVANGRTVYRNIKNAVRYLLSGNTAAILVVLYTSLRALPLPFVPVQLLFINLLTDSLPALAIGIEPADEGVLKEKPRDPKEGLMNREFLIKMLVEGALIALSTIFAFSIGLKQSSVMASTMAFATITLARLFHGFNCRSELPLLAIGLKSNPSSLLAFGIGACFLALVVGVPAFHSLFQIQAMNTQNLMQTLLLAMLPTLVIQGFRVICERKKKEKDY